MLGAEVYLLGLGDLFEEVLYDNSIIVASFAATHQSLKTRGRAYTPRCNLNVVVTLYQIDLQLPS